MDDIQLQPGLRTVELWVAYGYSLDCVRSKPGLHTVAGLQLAELLLLVGQMFRECRAVALEEADELGGER